MYERIRNQAIHGAGQRWELQAICYHGLLEGLRFICHEAAAAESPPRPECQQPDLCAGDAVMRQIANMILAVQAESIHAY